MITITLEIIAISFLNNLLLSTYIVNMNTYTVIFIICLILLATCFKFKERFDEYEAINHPISTAEIKYNNINATNEASLETEVAAKTNMLADY